jgi:hypothetical protein
LFSLFLSCQAAASIPIISFAFYYIIQNLYILNIIISSPYGFFKSFPVALSVFSIKHHSNSPGEAWEKRQAVAEMLSMNKDYLQEKTDASLHRFVWGRIMKI